MWDSTAPTPRLLTLNQLLEVNNRSSHISRKTSEIWGTPARGGDSSVPASIEGKSLTLQLIRDLDQRIGGLHLALNIPRRDVRR
jgi:hypothetical protein